MTHLETSKENFEIGRFRAALTALNEHRGLGDGIDTAVLRIEILERIGRNGEARALAEQLLKRNVLTAADRSTCEFVLGKVKLNEGNVSSAIESFQRAETLASESGNRRLLCWRQLWLWHFLANQSAPEATAARFSQLRSRIVEIGDARLTAASYIFLGMFEGKRGLCQKAEQHTRLGQRLLDTAPPVWLDAIGENTHVGVAIMRSDFAEGLVHAKRGLDLAEESGVATAIRAALGNLGNLCYLRGDFERAATYFDDAIKVLPSGETAYSMSENLARARLLQNRVDECARLLDRVDESIQSPDDRRLFVFRHSQLTRAQLLQRRQQWGEALNRLDEAMDLARQTGDALLAERAVLMKADLLQESGDLDSARTVLDGAASRLGFQPLELHAHYEQVVACALERLGRTNRARDHFGRAKRLYEAAGAYQA